MLLEQAYTLLWTLLSHPSSLHFTVLCVRGGSRRVVRAWRVQSGPGHPGAHDWASPDIT